jgi:hypothetical protein
MTNKVLLNNIDHHDLRVAIGATEFGDSVNQMLVLPTEFEDLQREFPIFFRKDESGDFQSVALLGLDKDENLFLGERGWHTRYVPAIQQHGPFSIAMHERRVDGEVHREPMVHIDLDDPRVSRTEGEPIFLPKGGNSPYLEHITRVLQAIHTGLEVNRPMFAAFEEMDLIEPVRLEISLGGAEKYLVPDRYTIAADKLAALGGQRLERLHAGGFLRAAFHVVSSLGNMSRLIELKNARRAAEQAPVGVRGAAG